MSRCEEAMLSLERALDEGATEAPAEVRDHLDSCPTCRDAWQELRAVEDLLAQAADMDACVQHPDAGTMDQDSGAADRYPQAAAVEATARAARLRARVMDAIVRERRHGVRRIGAEWWFAAAAALLLGVFGAARLMGPAPADADKPDSISADGPTTAEIQALVVSAQPQQVIASARQDFEWLGGAILSNARSAARMVGGAPQP